MHAGPSSRGSTRSTTIRSKRSSVRSRYARACSCPSTAVVASKNHLWFRGLITLSRPGRGDGLGGQGPARLEKHPALHLDHRGALGGELLDEVVGGDLGLQHLAAGEDVDGCVAVLGPRVDGEMGLRDDDDAADAERIELVEDDVDDGRLSQPRGLHQGALHSFQVVDGIWSAIKQLEKQMSSQSVQSAGPPFGACAIYRTS